ncbi:hypothetical protein B0H10DRAFT_1940815 [Mycena sp. CBHHK59/15]|nr:hypothetical protein B0H10DRAFT_1940815 [Mycena sp. CBHHK59/15]
MASQTKPNQTPAAGPTQAHATSHLFGPPVPGLLNRAAAPRESADAKQACAEAYARTLANRAAANAANAENVAPQERDEWTAQRQAATMRAETQLATATSCVEAALAEANRRTMFDVLNLPDMNTRPTVDDAVYFGDFRFTGDAAPRAKEGALSHELCVKEADNMFDMFIDEDMMTDEPIWAPGL